MRSLRDIKIVDMKRSKIDEAKSDPEKGKYVFFDKKYVDAATKVADNVVFSWCEYNAQDGYRTLNTWRVRSNWEAVKKGEDPYWPEGIMPNAAGLYQFGDLVLVRRTLEEEIADQEFNRELARRGKKEDGLKTFARAVTKQGYLDGEEADVGIMPEQLRGMRGGK